MMHARASCVIIDDIITVVDYHNIPTPTPFYTKDWPFIHPIRKEMNYGADYTGRVPENPPFKVSEISLAIKVICRYWSQINEYYRYSSYPLPTIP